MKQNQLTPNLPFNELVVWLIFQLVWPIHKSIQMTRWSNAIRGQPTNWEIDCSSPSSLVEGITVDG